MANLSNINNKFLVTTGGNVLIGQTSTVGTPIFQVAGNSRFSGEIRTANRLAIKETVFGYSSSYKVVQFGESAATKAISLGYDPSGNTNGSFSGNEILIPNNIRILAPAENNSGYYGLMMLNSSNKVLLGASNYLMESNYIMSLDTATKNVGIGTDSPDLRLHVDGVNAYPATSGTTPNGMLHLRAKTVGGSHGLYMGVANASPWGSWLQAADASNLATEYPLLLNPNGGNVGIGITSPSANLHVSSTSTATLKVGTTGVADASVDIRGYDAGVHIGDATNGLRWAVWNDGPSTSSSLKFGSYALGTWYNDGSQVVTMKSDGKVGVGTVSPSKQLQVQGSAPWIRIQEDSASSKRLDLYVDPSTAIAYIAANQSAQQLSFQTGSSDRIRIDNSGNTFIKKNLEVGEASNTTSASNNYIPIKINTTYSTTASPQWSLQGWVATTDGADPFAMTSGETTKNVYMGIIGAQYMNQNRFSIIQGGAERLTVNLTQTGSGSVSGNVGINNTLPTQKLDVGGLIKHQGLDMTSGSQVDQIKTFNVTLVASANTWTEIPGIAGTDLSSGHYMVGCYSDARSVSGWYYVYWTTYMAWSSVAGTNTTETSEMPLTFGAHATNGKTLELRTSMGNTASTNTMRIQFKVNFATTGTALRLIFRKLIS